MTEEAGARLRAAYAEPLNPSSQHSIDAAIRQREIDDHGQYLTAREKVELGEQLERRQIMVSRHNQNMHEGSLRAAGCPMCFPPGVDGEYRGTTWASARSAAT